MTLPQLLRALWDAGARRVYAKSLAENDNSKNQIYLGPNLAALNVLRIPVQPELGTKRGKDIYRIPVRFFWLSESGGLVAAPGAQLIFYPQYPEFRLSGFLWGARAAPSTIMSSRVSGRILILGVSDDGSIIAFAVDRDNSVAREMHRYYAMPKIGVFVDLTGLLEGDDFNTRLHLLESLKSIHLKGWIIGHRIDRNGSDVRCQAPNCGGATLEAELGVRPNSRSEPDYFGWEVKQHRVVRFGLIGGTRITLMTPQPTGGLYRKDGGVSFVRQYGYQDLRKRPDRLNVGGNYVLGKRVKRTGLTLTLAGFDLQSEKISDPDGHIALVDDDGVIAASWRFVDLLQHWSRKHAKAVYVPCRSQRQPELQYWFGNLVRLAEVTDFVLFLKALGKGDIAYDPGIKLENASSKKARLKHRNQFRISPLKIQSLYERVEHIDLIGGKPS